MTTSTQLGADTATLVKDLRALALTLEKDLLARAGQRPFVTRLEAEYDRARSVERIAASRTEWLAGRVTQAAAAWVLSTVFVRYCEDNDLIERPFLSGAGDRLTLAEEYQAQFFAELPTLNNRDYLVAAFAHIAEAHPAAAGLFDEERNPANPLWDITPSYEAANALIAFWRRRDDAGATRWDFTGWDTRFLGDLYQDLSEAARKTYALLQTPEFVEEFILDLTLTPAIEEFGLAGLRAIDPASGSGHFLLGLFHRILAAWREREPGTDDWTLIRRSMESVHGCDKNPFATAIARFRLLVAALHEGGVARLVEARDFPINVAVGDSLLHGRGTPGAQGELHGFDQSHSYSTEDVREFEQSCDLLRRSSYHVVVGNPPYITVKDANENRKYRERYDSCSGKYALSVPFAERFFRLAIRAHSRETISGFVGQITSNSFMKREFGQKLVMNFLSTIELTHVVDCSGAYVPNHGTPTVILIGRNSNYPPGRPVRIVRRVEGEPAPPKDPSRGLVWSSIEAAVRGPHFSNRWVSSATLERERYLIRYPWILADGALELVEQIEKAATRGGVSSSLGSMAKRLGFFGVPGGDETMLAPKKTFERSRVEMSYVLDIAVGDNVRDWLVSPEEAVCFPYDRSKKLVGFQAIPGHVQRLWPFRTTLGSRATFSKGTYFSEGRPWYEWHQLPRDADCDDRTIVLAEVATHNHFSIDNSERAYKQTAPVIKFEKGVRLEQLFSLLTLLNSSTACFWLQQNCHNKGSTVDDEGARQSTIPWDDYYQFNSRKLAQLPIPAASEGLAWLGQQIDYEARRYCTLEPSSRMAGSDFNSSILDSARVESLRSYRQMISLQEESDWLVYSRYGLISTREIEGLLAKDPEPLALGERAFEIVLARKCARGEADPVWFERHGSTPVIDVPEHWSSDYRAVVEARIRVIESRRDIGLIERPECKRRWAVEPWEKRERQALRNWLLDRCEAPELWYARRDGVRQPRTLTVSQLADRLSVDGDVAAAVAAYASGHLGKRDLSLADVLMQLIADEHVPFLASMRYQPTGYAKRVEWERVWESQREEDRTGTGGDVARPPEFKKADFRRPSFWTQRGKLDVPKERFISYPEASPDADPTLLLGWAGWDHKDQAQALVNLVNDRSSHAGWETERLKPLLAGLVELMPWVQQWHGEFDEEWDGNPAEEYWAFLDEQRTERGLTEDALRQWRPAAPKRGRRPREST